MGCGGAQRTLASDAVRGQRPWRLRSIHRTGQAGVHCDFSKNSSAAFRGKWQWRVNGRGAPELTRERTVNVQWTWSWGEDEQGLASEG